MDSQPPSTAPSARRSKSRRRFLWLIGIVVLAIFVLLTACFIFVPRDSGLTWLSPQQITQATKPGPFKAIKDKLRVWARPLVQWYRGRQAIIILDAKFIAVSAQAENELALGTPTTTNSDGARAWILDATNMKALQSRITNNPQISIRYAPKFQTVEGRNTQLQSGYSFQFAGKATLVGITMDVLPKTKRDSVSLTITATSTEVAASTPTAINVNTNFYAACRVLVPNAGGVVVRCNPARSSNGSNYWLIVRPEIAVPPPGSGNRVPGLPSGFELGK